MKRWTTALAAILFSVGITIPCAEGRESNLAARNVASDWDKIIDATFELNTVHEASLVSLRRDIKLIIDTANQQKTEILFALKLNGLFSHNVDFSPRIIWERCFGTWKYRVSQIFWIPERLRSDNVAEVILGHNNLVEITNSVADREDSCFNERARADRLPHIFDNNVWGHANCAILAKINSDEHAFRLDVVNRQPRTILCLHDTQLCLHYRLLASENDGLPRRDTCRNCNDGHADNGYSQRDLVEAIMLWLVGIASIGWGIRHLSFARGRDEMRQFWTGIAVTLAGVVAVIVATPIAALNVF